MKLNLRILVYLNPSNINKVTHKFNLQQDSGFIFVRDSILALNKIEDWHYYLLVPEDSYETCWTDKPKNVTLIKYSYMNDALNSRFHFDTSTLQKYFSTYRHDIDLMWTMLPEHAGALKAFSSKRREEIPVFSYVAWTDFKKRKGYEPVYKYSTAQGFENSDLIGIQSSHMLEFIKTNIFKDFPNVDYSKVKIVNPKTRVVDYPSAIGDLVAFPHRVSTESGFAKMYEMAKPILKHKLWITNINGASVVEDDTLMIKTYESHEEYYKNLSKIRYGISYHVLYSMWSMSVLDMMACGKVVLVPNKNAFPEMFPEDYPFFFNDDKEFLEKLEYLESCPDSVLEEWGNKNKDMVAKKFTWEHQAEELSGYFYSMLSPDKKNSKTKSVYDVIQKYKMITKGDIINRNTSEFHRQCSRAWNKSRIELLRDFGVKDDMTTEHTTFYMPDYDPSLGIQERPIREVTIFDLIQKDKYNERRRRIAIEKKNIKKAEESFLSDFLPGILDINY